MRYILIFLLMPVFLFAQHATPNFDPFADLGNVEAGTSKPSQQEQLKQDHQITKVEKKNNWLVLHINWLDKEGKVNNTSVKWYNLNQVVSIELDGDVYKDTQNNKDINYKFITLILSHGEITINDLAYKVSGCDYYFDDINYIFNLVTS